MPDSSADRDPLDRLAEEFIARFRAGERPSLEEYADRLPDRADEVRDLFPALVEMEQLKPVTADQTGGYMPPVEPSDPVRLGEFRILRRVGAGGMGVVYEALQESLGRYVALKLLPAEALLDPKKLERFRREAKAAAKLHHTNIVPVFGTGEADGRHFYAMQFISGHPLDAVIDEVKRLREKSPATAEHPRAVSEVAHAMMTGTFAPHTDPSGPESSPTLTSDPIPASLATSEPYASPSLSGGGNSYWATVARVGTQVADGLAYAHTQGIEHRDIKPANLLLDLRGTVWITDFGLAKASDADDGLTQMGDVVGTLRYMAPERFEGAGDHRADIYALGLTLYELLTLTPAFTASNRAKLVEQAIAAKPPRPRSINPAIPKDLETIVLKAIARDPAMRYQSAGDLADDLRRYQEDRPIRARRASSAEQAFRWCRRNPAVAVLLTAVLLVFAVGAGVSSYFAVLARAKATEARGEADRADAERDRANAEATKARAGADSVRRLLYDSLMSRAGMAFKEDHIPLVQQLLDEARPGPGEPDLRGWEWHYLYRLLNPIPTREVSLKDKGQLLAFTPDHRRIVTTRRTSNETVLEAWDLPTGRKLSQFPKQHGLPNSVIDLTGLSSGPKHFTLTADGKYFGLLMAGQPQKSGRPNFQLRIWDTETGEELPGPTQPFSSETRDFVIGPDAASVVWIQWPRPTQAAEENGQKPAITVSRWERATRQISQISFTPESVQLAKLSPDGHRVYFLPGMSSEFPGRLVPAARELRFESWEIASKEPKREWAISADPTLGAFGGGYAFSPQGTVLGVWTSNVINVYRLGDGKLMWRVQASGIGGIQRGERLSDISDDGTWFVILRQNRVCKVTLKNPPTSKLTGDGDVVPARETVLRITEEQYPARVPASDGRTVLANEPGELIRFFDVSKDPSWTDSLAESGAVSWLESKSDPAALRPPGFGPPGAWVVRNAVGKEIHRIEPTQGEFNRQPRMLLGGKRLLVQNLHGPFLGGGKSHGGETWELFATDTQSGITVLHRGEGFATADEAGGLIEVRTQREDLQPVFRSLLTGKVVGADHQRLSGQITSKYCSSPKGDHYAILTWPVDPAEPQKGTPLTTLKPLPITVRLYSTGTGDPVWSQEIDIARVGSKNEMRFKLAFSPDGHRIVLTYPPDLDGETRVWVGRVTDGVEERRISVRESDKGYTPVLTLRGFTTEGKLLLTTGDSVQVWDPETGRKNMDLRGNGSVGNLFVTTDGSRLFVKDLGIMGGSKILIWDFITRRLLMVLETPSQGPWGLFPFAMRNGRLCVPRAGDGLQVFDGSPVKE